MSEESFKLVNAEDLTSDFIMPEPTSSVESLNVSIESEKPSESEFNPSIHAVDNEGKPRLKKDGSYALKRGKKKGSNVSNNVENSNEQKEFSIDPKVLEQLSNETVENVNAIMVLIAEELTLEDEEKTCLKALTQNAINEHIEENGSFPIKNSHFLVATFAGIVLRKFSSKPTLLEKFKKLFS